MQMVQEIEFTIIKKAGDIELRKYPEIIMAVARGVGGDDSAFGHLFNYITGGNASATPIKMTAPVITPEKIDMTVPVITQQDYMAFVMPPKFNRNNIPRPTDPKVTIEIQEPRKVAVIRFSGRTTKKNLDEHMVALEKALKAQGWKSKGVPFLMRYNSPFVPGFLRHNEIGIEIV